MINMAVVDQNKIEDIVNHLDAQRENLEYLFRAYRRNVEDIEDYITDISKSDRGWDDPVSELFHAHVDSLKTGIVPKLNNSIAAKGPLDTLDELIELLENECYRYLTGIKDDTRPDDISATTNDPFDGAFTTQEQVISDILDQIASIRFDSDVADIDLTAYIPPTIEKKTVTVNQFDKVKVNVDGETKVMYYLGTDSQGRSYFSETLDNDATAYVTKWPGQVGTSEADINSWASKYQDNPWLYQEMLKSQAAFSILGGNTGTITKGNVLKKYGNNYANGAYVGDSNFNNSIVFENSYYAPEVVESGGNGYDAENAFHVLNFEDTKTVYYSDFKSGNVSLYDEGFPDIVLKPGEKITPSYGWAIFATNCTIGSDTESVILHYDKDEYKYFVVNKETGGYYTAMRENDACDYGFRSITIDKLREEAGLPTHNGSGASHGF